MISVKSLIQELSKYPEDAMCYAYEGEIVGVVITSKSNEDQLGYIECREGKERETVNE